MTERRYRKNILKNHKIFVIFSIILMIVTLLIITKTLSKYVLKQNDSQSVIATKFYFESNALSIDGKNNDFFDWNGEESYELNFDVFNFEDVLRYDSQDVSYTVNVENSSNITIKCFINDVETYNGILEKGKQTTDRVKLIIIPNSTITDIETLKISVISNLPYTKTLSGSFNIIVNTKKYDINLVDNTDYEKLIITTYDYIGNFKINYDSTKLMLYTDNMQTIEESIILQTEKNSNYQIEFIKLTTDKIELDTDDIRVEEYN